MAILTFPVLAARGGAFDPVNLNPALYLRADTGVTESGGAVSAWADQSGNGNDFSQATAAKKPTLTSNVWGSNPGVTFGGDDLMNAGSVFLNGTVGTVFALVKLTAEPNGIMVMLSSSDEASESRYMRTITRRVDSQPNITILQRNNDTTEAITGGTTISQNTDYIMVWRSTGTAYAMRVNGSDETLTVRSGADNGDWFGDVSARDNVVLGAQRRSSEGGFLQGHVGMVLAYDDVALSDSEIQSVESFLNDYAGGGIL